MSATRREAPEPLHYPPGSLAYDADEDRLRCHLCGGWYRALAPGHLLHKHRVDAAAYRQLAGLNPRHPLSVPSLSALRATQLRKRIDTDPRISKGMRRGRALARNGDLQRRARQAAADRSTPTERRDELRRSGRRVGQTRAATHRAARESAARSLGHPDLESYYRHRYEQQGARIADLQSQLGASYTSIRADLRRHDIPVHHGRRSRSSKVGSEPPPTGA